MNAAYAVVSAKPRRKQETTDLPPPDKSLSKR
jgi:hypothetical protein